MIFFTSIPQLRGELQNFQEFGSLFLEFSSEVSLNSGGRYSLSLVTIVSKVNHYLIGGFDCFLSLRLGQLDDAGLGTIGHEVACHAARGARPRHRLGWLARLIPLAARPGVHPRRKDVFLFELLRIAGQINALPVCCARHVSRCQTFPSHRCSITSWYCDSFTSVYAAFMAATAWLHGRISSP